MSSMRAKMKVNSIKSYPEIGTPTQQNLSFSAVGINAYPADGLDENNTFARWTPNASVDISIVNPALIGKFEIGESYYVDFTKAD